MVLRPRTDLPTPGTPETCESPWTPGAVELPSPRRVDDPPDAFPAPAGDEEPRGAPRFQEGPSGRAGEAVRGALRRAGDLLLPVSCVGCGAEAVDICAECAEDLAAGTAVPFRAEEPAEALPLIFPHVSEPAGAELPEPRVLPVCSAGVYDGLLSTAILAFKEREFIRLRRVLGPALARAILSARELLTGEAEPERELVLVWPPPSVRARLERSYQPVPTLLEAAGWPARGAMLSHRGLRDMVGFGPAGGRQKSRTAAQRRRRRQSLSLTRAGRERIRGAEVLIVDDVLTTGATIAQAYRVLEGAGARVLGAAVLAAARRGDAVTDSA